MGNISKKSLILGWLLFLASFTACVGQDFDPVYFPQAEKVTEEGGATGPSTSENTATGNCTVMLESKLCVMISGNNLSVGTGGSEPLCADIDPIPIEVSAGTNLVLRGSAFPDIKFEGHGLPAPITINGKGLGDGSDNIGTGTIDGSGNISIEDISLFINALGMVGEVPGLTLTTGDVTDLEGLEDIAGSPLAGDGSVKLVTGTVLGHLFPAADEKLYGASLQATFEGTITPPLSQCKGESSKPQSTFVTKLVVDENGKETEGPLPGSDRMEVGSAFIAGKPQDIGPKFESVARFKIINATAKTMTVSMPALVGPFQITAIQGGPLKQDLPPKTPLVIKVAFRPNAENIKAAGTVTQMLTIGTDVYQLVADAVEAKGQTSLNTSDGNGQLQTASDLLKVGEVMVSTTSRREFFSCKKISCNGTEKPTQCVPCLDVLINVCQLLQVDASGNPIGTVDASCKPVNDKGEDVSSIGVGQSGLLPASQSITVKNNGVAPLTIESVSIEEIQGTKSGGQFKVAPATTLPITINPYDISSDTISFTVTYEPSDLIGFDGAEAVVGHPVKDKAVLRVVTDAGVSSIDLVGVTNVKEVPALQVYFKSATGTKEQADASQFSFRGITNETIDLAVPVFIKLSDSATVPIRITKVDVGTGSAFEWLDTKEKIDAKPSASRCAIPVFDSAGGQSGSITDLKPVSLLPNGFDLNPGAFTADSMPLFGCVNFHRGDATPKQSITKLTISTLELTRDGQPARNPDGSMKQTTFTVNLLAVINPIKGHLVFRLTQTMAAVMNPKFPSISAAAAAEEYKIQIEDGQASETDKFVMPGALVLDPFDEDTIKDEAGNIITTPGDGVTAVYRKIDTHPVSTNYDDIHLPDYTALIFDGSQPDGDRGVFFDYPNVPDGLQLAGLRIYTASLSYPGPLATPDERPENISMCQQVDPCSEDGQRMMGEGPSDKTKRGVCAFFYGSAGAWDGSPSFFTPVEKEGGERVDLCKAVGKPQKLKDVAGYYHLDGNVNFPSTGLRLWGPNYFNSLTGPLGKYPPLDAVFNLTFTTGVLKPGIGPEGYEVIPDKRVNTAKAEHKINLNDPSMDTPPLCETSVKNRYIRGEYYSTWKYLAPLLVKDEEGVAPAGCPEPGLPFTGGSAYLRGRPLDQETGIVTFVATAKFASDPNLTFAFKDVMFFIVLNGWFCDPNGSEAQFEGARCYDKTVNERDGLSTISILK